jgi:hypothetical protein
MARAGEKVAERQKISRKGAASTTYSTSTQEPRTTPTQEAPKDPTTGTGVSRTVDPACLRVRNYVAVGMETLWYQVQHMQRPTNLSIIEYYTTTGPHAEAAQRRKATMAVTTGYTGTLPESLTPTGQGDW